MKLKKKKVEHKQMEPPVVGFVENGDPPKIITQMILPFLVSFLICVVAIAAFAAAFRNSNWFSSGTDVLFMKQAEQLQGSANIGDQRQEIELAISMYLDPYQLTKLIDASSHHYTLVDLRDQTSYMHEHIKTAINIPYSGSADVHSLEKAAKTIQDQPVILYSHTSNSQETLQAALFFLQHGIQTKILRIGWNEWRHFSNLWIPEPQWQTVQVDMYLEGEGY